ncbi:MAG: sel1 repeat family protein, partial [Lentisphaeria bacterium]|nr:sel1 repeat family protein [Lentisphaeria bacterium]
GPAQLKLAMLHLDGQQIDNPDPQYGFRLILDTARQGLPEAQYQIAIIYQDGKVVQTDPQRAFGWCRRAADRNYPPALGLLGDFYRQGVGCTANPAMARVYYEQGMRKGHVDSIYKLACLLESGESGSRVPEKAVKYYRMAADAGHPEAKAALARLVQKKPEPSAQPVMEPDPVPASSRDPASGNAETMYQAAQKIYDSYTTSPTLARQAYEWCWKASAKGHVKARGLLGIMNLKGFGCPIDLKEALRLLRDAAELGDAESLFQLGESYRLGIGSGQDSQMAIKFYRQAAAKGHQKAKQRLAGPRPKLKRFNQEEFTYHLSLANRGNLDAQYLVGMAFLKGNGTRPDPKKGYLWLMEAALRDHPDAQCQVGILLHDGIGCTRSYQAAFRWFSKAAAQEHPEGTYRLGAMYLLGKGLDRPDHQRAAELFHRAAVLGDEDAARSLDSLKRATLTNGR